MTFLTRIQSQGKTCFVYHRNFFDEIVITVELAVDHHVDRVLVVDQKLFEIYEEKSSIFKCRKWYGIVVERHERAEEVLIVEHEDERVVTNKESLQQKKNILSTKDIMKPSGTVHKRRQAWRGLGML